MIYFTIFLMLALVIAPISLLIHELGHLTGALLMKATSIRLTIGAGNILIEKQFQRVHLLIRKFFIVNSFTSTIREIPFRNREKIFITLMGPIFSSVLAFICYLTYHAIFPHYFIFIAFLFNGWLVIMNLLPYKIGQKQSDGYTICTLLFK